MEIWFPVLSPTLRHSSALHLGLSASATGKVRLALLTCQVGCRGDMGAWDQVKELQKQDLPQLYVR